ncbi:AAA family ATPase [Terasakiella pusilla]|uniref:AAA family ATPase n=1 Tax=Terasakiella pusilla TaxID=64973 RepID=UPI00048B0B6D
MKLSYSVKNLRRLVSTPEIEIKPITILLGRNSVGKSSFLRSLPLIRQTLETKTSAPILWYGDYVDFGNYKSAVNNNDTDKDIVFTFKFNDYSAVVSSNIYPAFYRRQRKLEIDE